MRTKAAIVCLLLCCGLLHGCIILPVPVPRSSGAAASSRPEISKTLPDEIVVGEIARKGVLLLLGEPDARGLHDQWFTYASVARRGGLRWALLMGAGSSGAIMRVGDWDKMRRLNIGFDEKGFVSAVTLIDNNCDTQSAFFNDRGTCPAPEI